MNSMLDKLVSVGALAALVTLSVGCAAPDGDGEEGEDEQVGETSAVSDALVAGNLTKRCTADGYVGEVTFTYDSRTRTYSARTYRIRGPNGSSTKNNINFAIRGIGTITSPDNLIGASIYEWGSFRQLPAYMQAVPFKANGWAPWDHERIQFVFDKPLAGDPYCIVDFR